MITIGTFTRTSDGAYEGAIRTLTLNAKAVRFRPVEDPSAKQPNFRINAGGIELGAAWKRTSKAQRDYLSVRIDDPSFAEPLHAVLIETSTGCSLIWSRWVHS